jgi:hypothetical protein
MQHPEPHPENGRASVGHSPHHGHDHGPMFPHPAQPAPWSILRMTVAARLVAAAAVSAALWAIVLTAMR